MGRRDSGAWRAPRSAHAAARQAILWTQGRGRPLRRAALPALLPLLLPELQRLLPIQLYPPLEQRHRLIAQQLAAGDLQPLVPAVPDGGPEMQHLAAVADPDLTG